MKVTRELYIKSPKVGHSVILNAGYCGPGLERREMLCLECAGRDDLPFTPKERFSKDNGRTWTPWQPLPEFVHQEKDRWDIFSLSTIHQDPKTGLCLGAGLRQTMLEKPLRYYTHTYWGISDDNGKTWSNVTQFRYEEGALRDPANPLDPNFLHNNQAYTGMSTLCRNGTIVLSCTGVNLPKDAPDTDPTEEFKSWDKAPHARDNALACFVGRFDPARRTYEWRMSNRVWVPLSVSCRGMQEAAPVELKDGRILIVCRGSNTKVTPGRKWFSLSGDGGLTLSEIRELRYDDGSRFYSPSSIHYFLRHSVSGKLYWLANICPEPPEGNLPRHPLVIAEIDETIPAVKRDTLTVIDTRQPGEGSGLNLSNFNVFENRETHEIEIYMSRYAPRLERGQSDPILSYEADNYKYTINPDD